MFLTYTTNRHDSGQADTRRALAGVRVHATLAQAIAHTEASQTYIDLGSTFYVAEVRGSVPVVVAIGTTAKVRPFGPEFVWAWEYVAV